MIYQLGYAKGVQGGHAGGHLTEPIIEALDDLQSGRIKKWYDAFNSHDDARMAAGKLWHCTDILGSHIRSIVQDEFHLEKEPFTYAQLSRVLLNDMRTASA